ncbi:MAG: tetratricopeptide repeat protein [Proteobacteria bacterium]|nr:tetratricopeptide repeat protein [Pseudomonadota bacterium]
MGLKTVPWLVALLGLTACRSTGSHSASPSPGNQAKDAGTLNLTEPSDPNKVPLALWSPSQRRATASYYFMAAEFTLLKERDAKKALQLYESAYSLDPTPFLGGKVLAARAAAGDRADALIDARKMVLLYPREAQLRYLYGNMLALEGQASDAITQLEKCIELDPQNEAAFLELADLYQNTKQTHKAIVVAKELTRHVPSSVAGWSQLSRLYLINSQHKEALVPARRAWEMQSANPQLTQIYAITLQLNGKLKQAVRIYEQLYHLDPTDEELTGRMVDLYRELGNLDSAIELLDEMIKQGGEAKPAVQMQKAILLWELKRNDEAARLLDQLVKSYPDSDRVRYLAAFGQERMDQFTKALDLYQGIAANSPLRKDADFRILMIIAKDKKRANEAYELARKLLDDPQATWEAYGVIAGVFGDTGHYDDAWRAADAGYKKYPDKPRLLFIKGVYEEKAGKRDACIATMRQVIKVDPENSSALNFLGYLFAEKGEHFDEAEQLITTALKLKPNDGFYLDSLGWLYYQKGDYKKAHVTLEQAVKMEPNEGVIFEHLGDVKKAMSDKAGAHAMYQKALRSSIEDSDKQRIEKKVTETQ